MIELHISSIITSISVFIHCHYARVLDFLHANRRARNAASRAKSNRSGLEEAKPKCVFVITNVISPVVCVLVASVAS